MPDILLNLKLVQVKHFFPVMRTARVSHCINRFQKNFSCKVNFEFKQQIQRNFSIFKHHEDTEPKSPRT